MGGYRTFRAQMTAPRDDKPRQRRSQNTRRRLKEHALRAFADLGHDGVNLARDILEPASVSTGSFYHQFSDKTELLAELIVEGAHRRREVITGLITSPTVDSVNLDEAITVGFERLFASFDDPADGWMLVLNERRNGDRRIQQALASGREVWADELARFLSRWTEAELDARRAVGQMLVALSAGLATMYLGLPPDQRTRRRPDLVANAASFALYGLGALD